MKAGERTRCVCLYVCVCVSARVSCMSACSREVDCESSLVNHKASAIKVAHFNTLSYSENTQMDALFTQAQATLICSVSLNCFFCFSVTYTFAGLSHKNTHTEHMSSVLTPPYVGLGVVADAKTRGTRQYQQSTECLLPLTHHHLTVLIINHTRSDFFFLQNWNYFFFFPLIVL